MQHNKDETSAPLGMTGSGNADRAQAMLGRMNEVSLNCFMGLEILEAAEGKSRGSCHGRETVQTPHGATNGCSYYVALEMAAGAAAGSVMEPGNMAMTTDLFVSILRAAPVNEEIEVTGRVYKHGRNLVFVECEETCSRKLEATARVTKSVVRFVHGE